VYLPIDDENAPLYAVGQVASMLGVQPAFLRRLDVEQVVQPARSDGGQRRYSRAEIMQVDRVFQMAGEGISLAGIRRIFELELQNAELRRQLEESKTHPHPTDGRKGGKK
jgi:MerR family transcriptional regulator, heat shock protein HspR